jgi:hypothetical protein
VSEKKTAVEVHRAPETIKAVEANNVCVALYGRQFGSISSFIFLSIWRDVEVRFVFQIYM